MADSTPARVIGIQFSIMSPDEILKTSVVEVKTRDTYMNNKPIINGLFDPRMGTLESNQICPTDGNDYYKCPGYIGHVTLAQPVFYIQYFPTVIKILKSVCIRCSKLKIDKHKYSHLLNMKSDVRWTNVNALAQKIRRCGEDTVDGCSCLQPKIKKHDMTTLIAEWDDVDSKNPDKDKDGKKTMRLTADIVAKILRRISDEDVHFMGFSPVWSRPEWMICEVLTVPPPSMRPSVRHDGQTGRAEDDMTHILVNILKTNSILEDKIRQNASPSVISDQAMMLQFFVSSQVDNRMPGSSHMSQRSGRPLKSIKDRLTGKAGRIRQNLMGKRVDYSARSVITPEPNISITELGVPMQIAIKLTRPVVVNDLNRGELMALVRNGPNVYPGARMLYKKSNKSLISLGYIDANSINLQNGDVVHRHMRNGDYVLFNRQPTVHRMSMMAHVVRLMDHGDSFRMNVGVTQPYNADFDGDEMNMHMPQDDMSEVELKELASIPNHIISPGTSKPIIGILQDSLLGCARFTRPNTRVRVKDAMNLLINIPNVDVSIFKGESIANNEILTQITPPITLHYRNSKLYDVFKKDFPNDPTYAEKQGVMIIRAGKYIQGQLEKSSIGSMSKGLVHRIYKDCGKDACVRFIDNLQHISNEYMKQSGYSVGVSDLIWKSETRDQIQDFIQKKKDEVQMLMHETHLGIFDNDTNTSSYDALEIKIMNLLNEMTVMAGNMTQRSLNLDNRFVFMSNYLTGSKGSTENIAQMIACVGQQSINTQRGSTRVPYGFNDRCLPHFKKFDDSPEARGFVERSFINGLLPTEVFFHAIAGRVGLIDTAVKTSETGYIQRRLVKSMEDVMVHFDFTVRNHKKKIIQFNYNGDCFDPIQMDAQEMPFIDMPVKDIYEHYHMPTKVDAVMRNALTADAIKRYRKEVETFRAEIQSVVDYILVQRERIAVHVMQSQMFNKDDIHTPINFIHAIRFVANQCELTSNKKSDITPMECLKMVRDCYESMTNNRYIMQNKLLHTMFMFNLSPKQLILTHHFNKDSLNLLLTNIKLMYARSLIQPGEMVGVICAQSVGEPTTQATLNTFHNAGVASRSNVTTGLKRIGELLNLSANISHRAMTIYLKAHEQHDIEAARRIMQDLTHVTLKKLVLSLEIIYDPDNRNVNEDDALINRYKMYEAMIADAVGGEPAAKENHRWIIRIKFNSFAMITNNITLEEIFYTIQEGYKDYAECIYSDYNDDNLVFRMRMNMLALKGRKKSKAATLDATNDIYILKLFQETFLETTIIRGVRGIASITPRKIKDSIELSAGEISMKEIWVLDVDGTNLIEMLGRNDIDAMRTISNDIHEVRTTLGVEAARQVLINELKIAYGASGPLHQHVCLLVDRMTYSQKLVSICRHGINNDNIGPIAKATFEEMPEMLCRAARHGELDDLRGVSANIMCGQEGYYGTNLSHIMIDADITPMGSAPPEVQSIEKQFDGLAGDGPDFCSDDKLHVDIGQDNALPVVEDQDYDIDL